MGKVSYEPRGECAACDCPHCIVVRTNRAFNVDLPVPLIGSVAVEDLLDAASFFSDFRKVFLDFPKPIAVVEDTDIWYEPTIVAWKKANRDLLAKYKRAGREEAKSKKLHCPECNKQVSKAKFAAHIDKYH